MMRGACTARRGQRAMIAVGLARNALRARATTRRAGLAQIAGSRSAVGGIAGRDAGLRRSASRGR